MTPGSEHDTAIAILDRYGDTAAQRGSPVWIVWRRPDAKLDTAEVHADEGLLGHTVPAEWEGAAVVGTGRFRLLDEAHEPPAVLKSGFSGGLTMACTLARDGQVGWRMRLPDGEYYDRVPEQGFMLDILHRCLGLATPAPPTSIAPVELGAWFAAIVGRSVEEDRRLDWWEALPLHPAAAQANGTDTDGHECLLRSDSSPDDWDLMRRLVASGLATAVTPSPELAGWMDAGMFSRWVLDGLPPLSQLLSAVRPHLLPAAYRRLCHLARGLDDRVTAG